MYALALGDSESASALLAAGANIDAVDAQGNPTVIYACHSMTQESVDTTLFGPVALSGERQTASVLGFCPLLQLLLDADADVGVCDEMGRSPLLSALGLGTLTLTLGGYTVKLSNSSYADGCSRDETMSIALSLVCAGVLVNACNREGVVPLHIAAARGHEELIILLKDSGAIANAEDEGTVIPLFNILTEDTTFQSYQYLEQMMITPYQYEAVVTM
jgi:ankyrin repeat protein